MKYKIKILIISLIFFTSINNAFSNETDHENYVEIDQHPITDEDPYESFNRTMFDFNMAFNDSVGKPVVNAYEFIFPQPVKTGVSNFFSNLTEPLSMVNSFLQGNVEDGLSSFMRFTINSTFGLFGLLDIATPAGLDKINEDFGQTLYTWGVWEEANYVVLPFLGPYTTRGLVGSSVDGYINPIYPNIIDTDTSGRFWLYLGGTFVSYVNIMKVIDDLHNQPDPYIFARESYLQYRTNLLYNGNLPEADLDDFDFE
ncbi:MAG: VacJ family lipoprotein [Gammaproteobacteria bacterium]|nr:VacJ family lipoprotein [Gammaproteobacteria bacterium]